MKSSILYIWLLLVFFIVLGGCAKDKMEHISSNYEIYGTWVNPEYSGKGVEGQKTVFYPDDRVKKAIVEWNARVEQLISKKSLKVNLALTEASNNLGDNPYFPTEKSA